VSTTSLAFGLPFSVLNVNTHKAGELQLVSFTPKNSDVKDALLMWK
jgi:hypothetical protein